jgi:azurin
VETIQNASDKAPINDYASLLAHMSADQLAPLKSQLAGIQKSAENPVLRMATTAALINTGESATGLLKQALDSRVNLETFLAAIPLISDDEARSSLYPTLQPLVHELPKHLRPEKAGVASSGVRYSYYKRFKNTLLDTIDNWEPDVTGTTDKFTLRIDGLNIERITLKFDSWINIPASGEWKFHLSSDDGSRLYIDGESIMDTPIGSSSASRVLSAGPHAIVLSYYDSGGGENLKLEWEGPGTPRSEVPAGALKSSGVDVIKRGLAEALTHIPGHDAGIFADFVTLLGTRQQGDLAIQTISAQPEDQWPADQIQPLAKALARFVPETPLEDRDGEVFQASLKLGERVAKKLPDADAAKLRATLADLDLQIVRIVTVVEEMRYDRPEFTVKTGSPVKLILENPDGIPHNLVIVKPGTAQKVAKLAEAMGSEGFEKQFLPESDDILHATPKLLNQNETATLSFEAPKEPGIYEYVCTFPGHWMLMRGKMHVVK